MLKKQTVWLLTMLSLMIVLSVYYMTSPGSGDLAYLPDGEDSAEEAASDAAGEDNAKRMTVKRMSMTSPILRKISCLLPSAWKSRMSAVQRRTGWMML